MIVVDASVLVGALLYDDGRGRAARAVPARDPQWAAPEHWTAEVFSAVRGLALGQKVSAEAAGHALRRLVRLEVAPAPLAPPVPAMWALRAAVSGYDAPYVALAAAWDLTLVTSDGRLARAAAPHCRVQVP